MRISAEEERAFSERIIRDFGDGVIKEGYLFDQINGDLGRRVKLGEALDQIAGEHVIVLLDPHNWPFARQVMNYVGVSETWRFLVSTERLKGILEFTDCDLYVTTRQGRLLLVACHEDDLIGTMNGLSGNQGLDRNGFHEGKSRCCLVRVERGACRSPRGTLTHATPLTESCLMRLFDG